MGSVELIPFRRAAELAERSASDWLDLFRAHATPGPFCVALLGGRIAPLLFDAFANRAAAESIDLRSLHFFWGDERCVPPGDPESNFAVAEKHLLRRLRIPPGQIHRIRGEEEPEAAAHSAELELRNLLNTAPPDTPVLDLVLLGMGEDGHVASLFPEEAEPAERRVGAPGLQEKPADNRDFRPGAFTGRSFDRAIRDPRLYRPVRATKPPPLRITLGYRVIAVAREVWVLASGPGKAKALHASVKDRTTPLGCLLDLRERTRVYSDIPASA
jgi:6-phosphogluconolactonase